MDFTRKISRIPAATIYLSPSIANVDIDEFCYYLCFFIDTPVSESTETAIIFTGDFNPNSSNFRSRHIELQCGLKQVVHVPTEKRTSLI